MSSAGNRRQLQRGVSPNIDPPTSIFFDGRAPSMSPTDAWDQVRYSIETTIVSAGPSSEYSSFSRASSVDTTFTDNNSQQDQTGIGPHGSVSTLRQEPKYISSHKAGRAKQQAMATSTAIAEDDEEEEPDVGSQTDSKYAPQQAGITPTYDRSNFRSYGGTRDTLYEHSHKSSDSLAAYARQRRDQEENGTTIYPVSAAHKAEMDRALNGGSDVYDKTVSEFEKALDELNINSGALDVSSTFSRRPESSASSATKGSESEYSGGSRGMAPTDSESNLDSLALMGFDKSRKVDGGTMQNGDNLWHLNLYHHPDRQGPTPQDKYYMQHDIYSLGVCLLKIGLWQSFAFYDENEKEYKAAPNLGFENKPEEKYFPKENCWQMKYNLERFARTKLPGHMGMYTKIVMKCLTRPDKVGAFNLYPDDEIQEPMPDETRQQKISLSKRYLEEVLEKLDNIET